MRIHVAQKIPGRTGITGHGRSFPSACWRIHPVTDIRQRPFTFRARTILIYMRQFQRQLCCIQRNGNAISPDDGEGFSPVSLAAKASIPHPVIYFSFTNALFFQFLQHHFSGIHHLNTIQKTGVFQYGFFCSIGFCSIKISTNNIGNGNVEMMGEFKISLIAARHRHDGPGAITCQYIFTDVNGNYLLAERVDGISTRKTTSDFFLRHTVNIAAAFYIVNVLIYCRGLSGTFYFLYQIQLGRYHHKINTKNSIRPCGVNCKW